LGNLVADSLCFALAALTIGCSTVPGTNRDRLDLLPKSTVDEMGRSAFADIQTNGRMIEDGPQVQRVKRVAERVIEAAKRRYPGAGLEDYNWEVVLIDDDSANAFALPGGHIGVHTGLLPVAQDDNGLAIVLGHEVAHVLAGHSGERLSQHLLIVGGTVIGVVALGDEDDTTQQVAMAALGVGTQLGIVLPYSRLHESEADELGLFIAAQAGYDPDAAIGLWQRMAQASDAGSMEFLSTHPDPQRRIEHLRSLLPEARAIARQVHHGP
jgi:predicted Zn-dependent protease